MSVTRSILVAMAVLVLTACMSSQSAGDAVKERMEQLSRSEYDKAWETLHPRHQAIVSREKFVECGLASEQIESPVVDRVTIESETTEERTIPELGTVEVRVVEAVLVKGDLALTQFSEMVREDGDWRWVLSESVLEDFRAGECP
jgi:hypothetical protein